MLTCCHDKMESSLKSPLELSMGMSEDYLQAVSVCIKVVLHVIGYNFCRYQLVALISELVLLYLDNDNHEWFNK